LEEAAGGVVEEEEAAVAAPLAAPVEEVPGAEPMVLEEVQPVSAARLEAAPVPQFVAC